MEPTIGRIVHCVVDQNTADFINQKIAHAELAGNSVKAGEPLAAVVVRVWTPQALNLKLILDASIDYWLTSVSFYQERQQDGPTTQAFWPERK
jgi:hypothetical protein